MKNASIPVGLSTLHVVNRDRGKYFEVLLCGTWLGHPVADMPQQCVRAWGALAIPSSDNPIAVVVEQVRVANCTT